jgi:hypothetical protein
MVNYVIAARPSLLNFVIADSTGRGPNGHSGKRLILRDVPGHLTRVLQILGWDSTPGLVTNQPAHLTASLPQ